MRRGIRPIIGHLKDQTEVVDQPASSSNQAATTSTGDLQTPANVQPGLSSLRIAPKEPVFEPDLDGPVMEKLMLWSSHLGDLWFNPKEGDHAYRLRTAISKEEPFSRFSLKMLIGSNEYLDEHGEMPEPVASSGIPVVEIPKGEEEEDPPGEWTTPEVLVGDEPDMRVHSKRTLYALLRRGSPWARFYVGVHGMGLLEENDAVSCPVMEVHEKYVVVDGSIIHDSSTGSSSSSETGNDTREEEDPAEEDPAEEEKWDLSTLSIGDFVTVKVTHLLDQSYDVWAEIVDDFRAVVITAPRQDLPKLRTCQSSGSEISVKRSKLQTLEVSTSPVNVHQILK